MFLGMEGHTRVRHPSLEVNIICRWSAILGSVRPGQGAAIVGRHSRPITGEFFPEPLRNWSRLAEAPLEAQVPGPHRLEQARARPVEIAVQGGVVIIDEGVAVVVDAIPRGSAVV